MTYKMQVTDERRKLYNFTIRPSVRELLTKKYQEAGFPSASAYLEFLILQAAEQNKESQSS